MVSEYPFPEVGDGAGRWMRSQVVARHLEAQSTESIVDNAMYNIQDIK